MAWASICIFETHCFSSSCLNVTADSEREVKGDKQVGIKAEQESVKLVELGVDWHCVMHYSWETEATSWRGDSGQMAAGLMIALWIKHETPASCWIFEFETDKCHWGKKRTHTHLHTQVNETRKWIYQTQWQSPSQFLIQIILYIQWPQN